MDPSVHSSNSTEYLLNKPDNLKTLLAEQGIKVRDLKQKAGEDWRSNPEVLDAIWFHLSLKSWDYDLGNVPPEQRGPRTMKIRWRLGNEPKALRFQNIFHNRFFLTGAEVTAAIKAHMLKPKILRKHPNLGDSFSKIEFTPNGKKAPILLTDDFLVKMPITFPGPMICFVGTFEFRVHWNNIDDTPPQQEPAEKKN